MLRRAWLLMAPSLALSACGVDEAVTHGRVVRCDASIRLELHPDPVAPGAEAYQCFAFDAGALDGRTISAILWSPPLSGGVTLHHATLYASTSDVPIGDVSCDFLRSSSAGLHVWAPGGTPLAMPSNVGLELPKGTRRLMVEAHSLRTNDVAAEPATVDVCTDLTSPTHVAAWIGIRAPVPAIRPRQVETSTWSCTLGAPFQVVSSWPHMHRLGRAFHGAAVRHSGERRRLVDVDPWAFDEQRTYDVDLPVNAGDAIETTCIWENPTDEYVLPGFLTTQEMCNQGIIGWPAQAAQCIDDG